VKAGKAKPSAKAGSFRGSKDFEKERVAGLGDGGVPPEGPPAGPEAVAGAKGPDALRDLAARPAVPHEDAIQAAVNTALIPRARPDIFGIHRIRRAHAGEGQAAAVLRGNSGSGVNVEKLDGKQEGTVSGARRGLGEKPGSPQKFRGELNEGGVEDKPIKVGGGDAGGSQKVNGSQERVGGGNHGERG
jgi:hypothetical protein